MKVLIVEDDKISLTLLEKCVARLGHTVIRSSGGETAWRILIDNPDFNLVITDIQMPDLDGRDLVRRMRDDETLRSLPVLMLSGIIAFREIDAALSLGPLRFLPKPIDVPELIKYINQSAQGQLV